MKMARYIAPKGATSISWSGRNYPVVKGILKAPEAAAADLLAHGYVAEADEVEAEEVDEDAEPTEAEKAAALALENGKEAVSLPH